VVTQEKAMEQGVFTETEVYLQS